MQGLSKAIFTTLLIAFLRYARKRVKISQIRSLWSKYQNRSVVHIPVYQIIKGRKYLRIITISVEVVPENEKTGKSQEKREKLPNINEIE